MAARKISLILTAAALCMLTACTKVELVSTSESESDASSSAPAATTTTYDLDPLFPEEEELPEVTAKAAILYDVTKNEIVFEKNAQSKIYPASLTKLLTALVAVEYTAPEFIYYVGDELYLLQPDSSVAWLAIGEGYTRDGILKALLTPSGNDAAYTIAVNVARKVYGNDLTDEDAVVRFAALMNDYAKGLGCTGTNFTVPDGFHDDNHYTTADDMLKIAAAAAKNDAILEIVGQEYTSADDTDGYTHYWHNGNVLLRFEFDFHALGLKTGFTDEAGFCFAGYVEKDGTELIVITFDSIIENRYGDTLKLIDYGFGEYDPEKEYLTPKEEEEEE